MFAAMFAYRRHIFIGVVVLVVGLAFSYAGYRSERVISFVSSFGYLGVAAALLIPANGASFMPVFLAAGLSWYGVLAVLVSFSVLMDVGSYVGALLGWRLYTRGRENQTVIAALEQFRVQNPYIPYAALAAFVVFVPLPKQLMLVPMGIMGYKPKYVIPIIFIGDLLFNMLYATGAQSLFSLISR